MVGVGVAIKGVRLVSRWADGLVVLWYVNEEVWWCNDVVSKQASKYDAVDFNRLWWWSC